MGSKQNTFLDEKKCHPEWFSQSFGSLGSALECLWSAGLRVNLDGTRHLLDACRARGTLCRGGQTPLKFGWCSMVQCTCRFLVGFCCFFSSPKILLETHVPLLEGTPVPKFVFTSSLAVFGETYVEAGTPVGYVLTCLAAVFWILWCLPLIQHVGHQVDVVTWIFMFPSSCDCFLQVILTRLCQRTLMAWRKLVASCWSMTTQGDHFWDRNWQFVDVCCLS